MGEGGGHLNFNSIIVKNGKSTFKSSVMPLAWSSIPIFILIDSQESPLCPLTNLVEQFALQLMLQLTVFVCRTDKTSCLVLIQPVWLSDSVPWEIIWELV